MPGPKSSHLLVLGAFAAALGLVFLLEALSWFFPFILPRTNGIGAVAGGVSEKLASALVLLLAGIFIMGFAGLRRRRLK